MWIPLEDEAATTQLLLERGWAVSPGERFRFHSPPGIRVTITTLEPGEAVRLAAALREITAPSHSTYLG